MAKAASCIALACVLPISWSLFGCGGVGAARPIAPEAGYELKDAPQQQRIAWAQTLASREASTITLTGLEQRLMGQMQKIKDDLDHKIDGRFWVNIEFTSLVYLVALIALYPYMRQLREWYLDNWV